MTKIRKSISRIGVALFTTGVGCALLGADAGSKRPSFIFVATYSPRDGEGIFYAEFDPRNGSVGDFQPTGGARNTAALALHPGGKFVYATTPAAYPDQEKAKGGVAAFEINEATGALHQIDRRPSGGNGPCYLGVDRAGQSLVVANCGTATVACLSLRPDGRFGDASSVIQHEGESQNIKGKALAHSINVAPGNRFAIAADMGLDRLFLYRLEAPGSMARHAPLFTLMGQGAGPRHLAFDSKGQFAYSINELANTVTVLRFNSESGTLTIIQTVSTLPDDFRRESFAADIQVHPGGRFLFGSNRGHDSIAVFRIEESTGRLHFQGCTPSGGKFPRSLAVDSSGRFLIVANQKSDRLSLFRVDSSTGNLEPMAEPSTIPQPVCVRVLARP